RRAPANRQSFAFKVPLVHGRRITRRYRDGRRLRVMQFDDVSLKRLSIAPLKRAKPNRLNASTLQRLNAFALYEVLLGITIFALGVIALGHAVENCLNASTINAEEGVVRQILSNRMAEIQATKGVPDDSKEIKVDTNYGGIKVVQKATAAELTEPD